MDLALVMGAALLGLAGMAHCTAMCGAACIAVGGAAGPWGSAGFQLGRLASYSAAGAVASASVGTLGRLGQWSPALKPLWIAVHVVALGLGVWLLLRGAQPRWVSELAVLGRARAPGGVQAIQWSGPRQGARSGLAGLAWVAWPCGLLQSALVMASLANTALAGAMAMAAFALVTSIGLLAGPWLLRSAARFATDGDSMRRMLTRASGLLLVLTSGWALGHGLWQRLIDLCFG
ncbi:MAG: sulfite exporter TauE/SafE family protein [Burkholderiaceae bacterium]